MTNQRRNTQGQFSRSLRVNLRLIIIILAVAWALFLIFKPTATVETINEPISASPENDLSDSRPEPEQVQKGLASWYDYDLNRADQKCLDDNCWSMTHRTCASRDFKRYSTVIVKNLSTGKEVECYVNDRIGHPDRIIDLSSFAFSQLADLSTGLINVEVRYK